MELTEKGNLEIGSHDAGHRSPPGGSIVNNAVTYYLLASGDFRVVIDDRYGNNQGYFQQNGGDKIKMDAADLDEAIQLAKEHIESLDDSTELLRAWRIASTEARTAMRNAERESTAGE